MLVKRCPQQVFFLASFRFGVDKADSPSSTPILKTDKTDPPEIFWPLRKKNQPFFLGDSEALFFDKFFSDKS